MKDKIIIEHTLRDIFNREVISANDVVQANKLFDKWIAITKYRADPIEEEKKFNDWKKNKNKTWE